jgi:hypothetical protein
MIPLAWTSNDSVYPSKLLGMLQGTTSSVAHGQRCVAVLSLRSFAVSSGQTGALSHALLAAVLCTTPDHTAACIIVEVPSVHMFTDHAD